jgi:hypothetical protein
MSFFRILGDESREFFTETVVGVFSGLLIILFVGLGVYADCFEWLFATTKNVFFACAIPLVVPVVLYLLCKTAWIQFQIVRNDIVRDRKQKAANNFML